MVISSALLAFAAIMFLVAKDIQCLSVVPNNSLRHLSRRNAIIAQFLSISGVALGTIAEPSFATEAIVGDPPVEVVASGDAKKVSL
jgi:hypothetical protein